MHNILDALGIINIWQPLIACALVYIRWVMHWEASCCMVETVTVVCAVCGLDSQAIQRTPLQALESKWQINWHQQLTLCC